MTDLLKKQLGFDGIIISDAVEMVGFSGFMNYYEACAKFLDYGGDILLFASPDKKMLEGFTRLIKAGVISEQTLQDRVTRVLAFIDQVNNEFKDIPSEYQLEEHKEIAKKVIDESITIVRDREQLIPVRDAEDKRVLHLIVSIPNFKHQKLLESFENELKKHFKSVEQWTDPGNHNIMKAIEAKKFDLIICSIGNDYNFGTNVIRLNGFQSRNLMGGWVHMDVPVIFVSHFHPFTHLEYKALMNSVINTHGTVEDTLPILAEKIVGLREIKNSGKDCSPRDWTLRDWLKRH